ncbi:hypothetical protein [Streptomyces clavifer]|uniref:hypothetical protein n=1 Tax=Streptomyces clavifer TaxID=68188 RepID=UPI00381097A3
MAGRTPVAVRCETRREARDAELDRARREQDERFRRLEAGKWPCPTCQRPLYPEDGDTSGDECGPCQSYRRRAAEEATTREDDQAKGGGILGWRHRT